MLSKAQKIILYLSAVAALVLGVVLIIPFRAIPGLSLEEGAVAIIVELVAKTLILFPIAGLSVYPTLLKYKQIEGKFERSRFVNIMSYLPLAVYTGGLLTLNLNLLSYNQDVLGITLWVLAFLVLLFDLVFIVVGFILLPKFLMKLTKKLTIIFDSAIATIAVCVAVVTIALSCTYLKAFGNAEDFFGNGSPILFFTYVLTIACVVIVAILTYKMMLKDQTELYINFDLQREEMAQVKAVAYHNAYNDILDEFEEFFEEQYIASEVEDEDEVEELEEAEEVASEEVEQQEVEKKVVVVKDEEDAKRIAELEAQIAELEESHSEKVEDLQEDLEDAGQEVEAAKAEAEAAKSEAEALKAAAAAEIAEAEAEAARKAELAAEKAKLVAEAKKAIKPSYNNLVNYASALEDDSVTVVANEAETQHKFYYNKKLFLVLADTNVDYRITFLASKESAIDLIIENPKNVSKATSPKGPNWYKLINKGTFEGDQLKSIIKNALEQQKVLIQEAEEEKARIKAEKAAAKKAEKASKAK